MFLYNFKISLLGRFDVPDSGKAIVEGRYSSSEQVQTEETPIQLEDWFNSTSQIDDSRYVIRGQRILNPTRYTTTMVSSRSARY